MTVKSYYEETNSRISELVQVDLTIYNVLLLC